MIARARVGLPSASSGVAGHPPYGSSQRSHAQCGAASATVARVRFARYIRVFVWLFGRGVPQFGG